MRGAVRSRRSRSVARVPAGIKKRRAISSPIPVDRKLQRPHARIDVHAPACKRVEVIVPKSLVKGVAHVHTSDVSVSRPSQEIRVDLMCSNRSIHHTADGRRPHQKAVVVKMHAAIVAVVMKAEFRGVTLGQKVLHVNIRDVDLLPPVLECVESAVRIFLEEVEPRQVVGDAIGAQISEDSYPRLLLRKQKAAKIARELLNS